MASNLGVLVRTLSATSVMTDDADDADVDATDVDATDVDADLDLAAVAAMRRRMDGSTRPARARRRERPTRRAARE